MMKIKIKTKKRKINVKMMLIKIKINTKKIKFSKMNEFMYHLLKFFVLYMHIIIKAYR